MEFSVIFPNGDTNQFRLKSKELKGSFLIAQVFHEAKIEHETAKYFGLRYLDKDDGGINWITPELNLKKLSYIETGTNKTGSNIQLLARFFPKDPDLVFSSQPRSRSLFCQLMNNMLTNEELGCDINTHATLNGLRLQSVYGNIDMKENKNDYFGKYHDLEIDIPTLVSCRNNLTQGQYYHLVQKYHKKFHGIRQAQAEIMFLNEIQNVPFYGYNLYSIVDKTHESNYLALSEFGLCFIYDSCIEKHTFPPKTEEFSWSDLIYCQIDNNIIRFGFFPQFGGLLEKKIKVKSKYSHKGALRLQEDLNCIREMFSDVVDGQIVFDSRKSAQKFYTTLIPQKRHNSLSEKFHSLRSSLRRSVRRTKSDKSNNSTLMGEEKSIAE